METIQIRKKDISEFSNFAKGFSISTIVLFHLLTQYNTGVPEKFARLSIVGGHGIFVCFFLSG